MSTKVTTPTIAYLGATGGCANACLVHSIRGGYRCVVLARTPDKLRQQLINQGISENELASKLIITQGNALNTADVKKMLTAGGEGTLPTWIVTGLGAAPEMRMNWRNPLNFIGIDQPKLCGDAADVLVSAVTDILREQPALKANKPGIIYIATTGISRGPEDVPFGMRFLYHQMLAVPHKDKRRMDDIFRGNLEKSGDERAFRSATGIRPTLLTGSVDINDKQGVEGVRAGVESAPETGFTIKRADVGEWIFRNVIEGKGVRRWEGEMISLAH